MKVVDQKESVNAEVVNTKESTVNVRGMVVLYNRKTGKAQEFHRIDVKEVLNGYSHEWSESPIIKEQKKAEDAVIVKPKEEPKAADVPTDEEITAKAEDAPVIDEPRRTRGRRTS